MSGQGRVAGDARPGRPEIPESYGVPKDAEGTLAWEDVGRLLSGARNYWISTVRPDGRPHAVPVWGVWVDGAFHFGGGRTTRKAKNIAQNPGVVAHSESGDAVVIVEGVAEEVTDSALQERLDDAYEEKYGIRHGTPVWALEPRVIHAWTDFPKDATRWTFGDEDLTTERPDRGGAR